MGQQSESVLAVIIVFFVFTWLAVGARVYTRAILNKSFGADDTFIVVMQIFYTAYLVSQIQGHRYGMGRHQSDLTPEDRTKALMWWFICFLLYIICVGLFKISLGFFLLRVAVDRLHILTLRLFTWGTVLIIFVYFFLVVFQCSPPSTFWLESPRAPGKCFSDPLLLGLDFSVAIVNCVADWTYGLLPLLIVRSLNMQRRTKRMVMAILGFAAIGSTATFVRMFFLPKLARGDDFLYDSTVVAYLSTVECGVGITAVSIGTLKPLWEQWRQRRGNTTANSRNSTPWTPRALHTPRRKSYIRTRDNEDDTVIGLQTHVEGNAWKATDTTTTVSGESMESGNQRNDEGKNRLSDWNGITKSVEVTQSERNINDHEEGI